MEDISLRRLKEQTTKLWFITFTLVNVHPIIIARDIMARSGALTGSKMTWALYLVGLTVVSMNMI